MGLVGCLRTPGLAPEESHMIGSSCLHNPCRGIICYNHGSCVASAPKPTCACQPDFTGKLKCYWLFYIKIFLLNKDKYVTIVKQFYS